MMNKLGKNERYAWEILNNFKKIYKNIMPYISDIKWTGFNEMAEIGINGNQLIQFPNGITHVRIEVLTSGDEKLYYKTRETLSVPIECVEHIQREIVAEKVKAWNISLLQVMDHGNVPNLLLEIELQHPINIPTW